MLSGTFGPQVSLDPDTGLMEPNHQAQVFNQSLKKLRIFNQLSNPVSLTKSVDLTNEWHYPDHNYLGPGTNLLPRLQRGDVPVDYDDMIAQQHDIEYTLAENWNDIQNADDTFIRNVGNNIGNLDPPILDHALLAANAIKLKGWYNKVCDLLGVNAMSDTKQREGLKEFIRSNHALFNPI